MRAIVAPGITVMPSRTISSASTPPIGAVSVIRGCVRPVLSTSRICCFIHAGLPHALTGSVDQRGEIGTLHAPQRQEFFLRGDPVGDVEFHQRLALGHTIERRTHMQALHKAGRARLHDRLIALVVGDASDGGYLRRQHAFGDNRSAHAEVLLDTRTDGDLARIGIAVGITGTSIMFMNGDLAGLSNLLPGTMGSW